MHTGNVTEQIEAIRQQTVGILEALRVKEGEFELAAPPPALVPQRSSTKGRTTPPRTPGSEEE